jgi:uncharacterized phage-associated protein
MSDQAVIAAPASAAAVANYFLAKAAQEPGLPPIDQMKLQKLLFYAHSWYLALYDRPLFEEGFEAWPWGPVVRDIYTQTKDYGRAAVTAKLQKIAFSRSQPLNARFETPEVDDDVLKAFLDAVWDIHKSYTGVQLSNATHGPGEPWTVMKETYGSLDSKPMMPNELIADIFKQKLRKDVPS